MDPMTPVYLPSQHASVHALPDDPAHLGSVLADAVRAALRHQQADGNLEDPAADDDIGDMSLGVTSLLCLAWQRGERTGHDLVDAVRRSIGFFLRERVFRADNPGEPFLRIRDSGEPYARYLPGTGEHPFGDWPSTVWAMLHAVNVLELADGLLTETQYTDVADLALGYWRWLTRVSVFNPQQTANQAIGAITAGLMLGRHLRSASRPDEGDAVVSEAMRLYAAEIQALRVVDRGYDLPLEHGAGHDQNYVPISLTFLAQAYRVSGEKCFLDDGEQIARHLDARLSARGFDFGGPRYSEQHSGCEAMLGLRFFGGRVHSDLGRYLGDRRVPYYSVAQNGAPSGHFAFTTVWYWQDESSWYRTPDLPACTPYSLRTPRTSISFTADLTPYVIDAADTAVIEAIADHQHGIGPLIQYPGRAALLLTRPLGPLRSRDLVHERFAAKLVTKPVVTREQVTLQIQQLHICLADRVFLIAAFDRSRIPADAELRFLAGLPYTEADGDRQRKILTLTAADHPTSKSRDHTVFPLSAPDAALRTRSISTARLTISTPSALHLVNPPEGRTHFSSPQTIGLTQEQVAFSLADDPRGYGDPDGGWRRVAQTNRILAEPITDAPPGTAVFVLCYEPSAAADPWSATAESTRDGLLVRTPFFTALIGDPAGDAHGDPVLRLTPTAP